MDEVLTVGDLRVAIAGRPLLHALSLTIRKGEVLGLVGQSGSGKSLTALCIIGLPPPASRVSGTMRLGDIDLTTLGEAGYRDLRGRRMGLVFQEPATALDPVRRIGDQVAEAVLCHGRSSRQAAGRLADAALAAVGLDAAQVPRDRYPHQLSGGQRQRVAIAMATVLQPQLLLLDEPTTALDPVASGQILALVRDLARRAGTAVMLISHDLAAVASVADRLVVLNAGEVVEEGPCATLMRAPSHPYTRALMQASAAPARSRPPVAADAPVVLEAIDVVCTRHGAPSGAVRPARAVTVLDRVSVAVRAGECVGLVGLSGSGKSTLLRAVLGLQPIRSGLVRIDGQAFAPASPADQRRLRRDIQPVLQDPYASFDPRWRVERIVAEPLTLADPRPDRSERRRRVEDLLQQLGLAAQDADRPPHAFSGGQRQRIAIARALILDPKILVLDEVTAALDVLVRAQILDLLAAIGRRRSLAMLFVSHDLATLRGVTDRIFVLDQGRIVEEGPTERVFAAPTHPVTAALVATTPQPPRGAQA